MAAAAIDAIACNPTINSKGNGGAWGGEQDDNQHRREFGARDALRPPEGRACAKQYLACRDVCDAHATTAQ